MPKVGIAAKQGVRLANHTIKNGVAYIGDSYEASEDNRSKTACLDMGEWIFVSFRATELRNIPVFIKGHVASFKLKSDYTLPLISVSVCSFSYMIEAIRYHVR